MVSFCLFALLLSEPGKAHRRTQFEGIGLLPLGNIDGCEETGFGIGLKGRMCLIKPLSILILCCLSLLA
jgi:hypothetical protein